MLQISFWRYLNFINGGKYKNFRHIHNVVWKATFSSKSNAYRVGTGWLVSVNFSFATIFFSQYLVWNRQKSRNLDSFSGVPGGSISLFSNFIWAQGSKEAKVHSPLMNAKIKVKHYFKVQEVRRCGICKLNKKYSL